MTIPIDYALTKLQIPFDETKSNFYLTCPCCGKEMKLNVNLEKGLFRCAVCGVSGNAVHLYACFTGRPIFNKETAKEDGTYRMMEKELMGGKQSFSEIRYNPIKIVKKDVPVASKEQRGAVYQELNNILSLTDSHYNNLVKRGLRERDIVENEYRSAPPNSIMPAKQLREKGILLKGIPGFFYENEVWRIRKNSGMYIPVRDIMQPEKGNGRFGQIVGIQIRSDKKSDEESKKIAKYTWLSSIDLELGAAAVAESHFVGYPENTIRITEGPLKGDIIYRFLNAPVLAIPGVASQSEMKKMLPVLWKYGVRRIKTAFDMDYLTNVHVQSAFFKLVKTCREYGFQVERELWDENYKGLDDYLLHAYLEKGGKLDKFK